MSIYYSSAGGGGGAYLAGLGSSLSFLGWPFETSTGADPPPTLPKKSLIDLPLRLLTRALTRAAEAFTLAALRTALIEWALIDAPWAESTKAAYETASCSF